MSEVPINQTEEETSKTPKTRKYYPSIPQFGSKFLKPWLTNPYGVTKEKVERSQKFDNW